MGKKIKSQGVKLTIATSGKVIKFSLKKKKTEMSHSVTSQNLWAVRGLCRKINLLVQQIHILNNVLGVFSLVSIISFKFASPSFEEELSIIIPLFQVRKLKLSKIKWLGQEIPASKWNWNLCRVHWIPSSVIPHFTTLFKKWYQMLGK